MSVAAAQPVTYGRDASTATFSVSRYQRMIEVGVLTPEDKVELLENYVVLKQARNPLHDGTSQLIGKRLPRWIPSGWDLRTQLTVVLPDSQPEPDCAVARGDERTYLTRHPLATDVGLIIEVAESSLLRDQRDKTRIYARAGIPVYWIVNLVDQRVEVYAQPSGPTDVPAYGSFQTYRPGDAVPLVLDGAVVATVPAADLLP
jgi:Uma2 family endonuclease